ncbi:MAG: MtnX-like HAD-IB family phosphatase [Chloroflexi bacterium]|nr:MtnX-like HAD-IB family phosphatase [Chloroflexota bacterium]
MTPAIFIDFDGTIVPYDVEFEIFKKFGGEDKAGDVVARWERKELNVPERLTLGFTALREAGVKKSQLDKFLKEVPLDPSFPAFLDFLHRQNWQHAILSDGLVWYIEGVFKKHKLDLPLIISNDIDFENNWRLSFPHHNGDCSSCRQCAACKRYPIREAKAWSDLVVLITDGRADRWAAIECDVVFAKEPLLSTLKLWKKPRKVFAFENFEDVEKELTKLGGG